MASDPQSFDEKKDLKFGDSTTDKIEDVSDSAYAEHLANLSGIEATAASKAAWLISITVSLGGLLFGMETAILIRTSH
jgi:SP family myo-inositol transporter-like MFS transporter 13